DPGGVEDDAALRPAVLRRRTGRAADAAALEAQAGVAGAEREADASAAGALGVGAGSEARIAVERVAGIAAAIDEAGEAGRAALLVVAGVGAELPGRVLKTELVEAAVAVAVTRTRADAVSRFRAPTESVVTVAASL